MRPSYQELTLMNLLTDPIVRTVMAADRVDPDELTIMLAGVAQSLKRPARRSEPVGECTCAM